MDIDNIDMSTDDLVALMEQLTIASHQIEQRLQYVHTELSRMVDLEKQTVKELKAICKASGLKGYSRMRKHELIQFIREK
jgi:hypothetical protein